MRSLYATRCDDFSVEHYEEFRGKVDASGILHYYLIMYVKVSGGGTIYESQEALERKTPKNWFATW